MRVDRLPLAVLRNRYVPGGWDVLAFVLVFAFFIYLAQAARGLTGSLAHPLVNVYCGGRRVATLGEAPSTVPGFVGEPGSSNFGAMWRVADVTVHVDRTGVTTGCTVRPIHPPGTSAGYYVTQNDPSF